MGTLSLVRVPVLAAFACLGPCAAWAAGCFADLTPVEDRPFVAALEAVSSAAPY
jgi:hypothetical protein